MGVKQLINQTSKSIPNFIIFSLKAQRKVKMSLKVSDQPISQFFVDDCFGESQTDENSAHT